VKTVQFQSQVAKDGVLALRVPLGPEEAGQSVNITIEPISRMPDTVDNREEWHQFVEETCGSCAELGLERPDQGRLALNPPPPSP
jgi:hypothetical protein